MKGYNVRNTRSRDNISLRNHNLKDAISCVEQRVCSDPSLEDLTFLVEKCQKQEDLNSTLRLYTYIQQQIGLASQKWLVNSLLSMIVEISKKEKLFDVLSGHSESSWNALIRGFARCGKPRLAVNIYQQMLNKNQKKRKENSGDLCPCPHTFVALLQACAKLKDPETGELIHKHVTRIGLLEKDSFVGSSLIQMYVKCGLTQSAQEVFDDVQHQKNVVSWTILISGYVEHGFANEALECFEKMLPLAFSPNAITLVYVLKACGKIGASNKLRDLHLEIERKGLLQTDIFIGSTLIDTYAKLDLMEKAQDVFNMLAFQNVVCWNALITGYAEHDQNEEVLKCYEQMRLEGNFPNSITFSAILKACGDNIETLHKGQQIHIDVERQERDLAVNNALVNMYLKHGLFSIARPIFDKLITRDVITWTSLISAYVDHASYEEALDCFEKMQLEGIFPDSITFIYGLKACGNMRAIDKGQKIHAQIEKLGLLEVYTCIGNFLLDMYAKCGLPYIVRLVFNRLPARDETSWASLMSSYAEHGLYIQAIECFDGIKRQGLFANEVSFVSVLKACCGLKAIEKGREIHGETIKKGLSEKNPFLGSIVVDMYAKCGHLIDARKVFDELKVRNEVPWTALISGYAEDGQFEEALKCLEEMQYEGIPPDATTFICTLKACGNIGASHHGGELHTEIERRGFLDKEFVGNTLVNMYLKCGSLTKAQQVFDKLQVRDVVSWTTLMAGYVEVGKSESVFHAFEQMLGEGIKPNLITFVVVLNACSRQGLLNKSGTYFQSMTKDYGITPTIEHHSCIVDLLSRVGELEEAEAMIKKMPIVPNFIIWHTLLGASKQWGTLDFGKQAFQNARILA